jgi:hypothetical protein
LLHGLLDLAPVLLNHLLVAVDLPEGLSVSSSKRLFRATVAKKTPR